MSYKANSSENLNQFAFDLYKFTAQGKSGNVFFSPYSIASALNLCYTGAKNNTKKQIAQILNYIHLKEDQISEANAAYIQLLLSLNDKVKFNVANKLFPKFGIKLSKEYVGTLFKFYNTDVECLDYGNPNQSVKRVNSWVERETRDKIKNLLDPSVINPLTAMILINAVYFKGDWQLPFQKVATTQEDFHLSNGTVEKVDMMALRGEKFKCLKTFENLNASVCELPYCGKKISMTIFLPHDGINIDVVETQLKSKVIRSIFEANKDEIKIDLYLPKFKFEQKFELSKTLSEMGMKDAFKENLADFSGIAQDEKLYISNVLHKAVIEVNEEGTEAAAATSIVMVTRMAMIVAKPFVFRCDKPFLFFIHDNENHTILFIGKYEKP